MIAKSAADANSVYGDLVEETGADKKVAAKSKVMKKPTANVEKEKVSYNEEAYEKEQQIL